MAKHLLHVFSTFAIGGPQVRFAQIANARHKDYTHSVIALDGNTEAKSKLTAKVDIEFIASGEMKTLNLVQRFHAIKRILKNHRHDVLMTYNWGSMEWALVNRLSAGASKHIHWEDGFGPEEQAALLPRRNLFRRLALSGNTQVVVPSQNLMAIAHRYWHIPAHRLTYFPNGIGVPTAPPRLSAPAPSEEVASPVLITLATLRAEKNIPRLIDTFIETVPQGRLLIGGGGPLLAELQQYVNDIGAVDRIEFQGDITDIWGFLAQGHIFCLSSDTEQMPISILEAMAMGLPVISTDVGDIKNMLSLENQRFVSRPEGYSEAFQTLLATPEQWQEIGAANRRKVADVYSFQEMLNNFANLV